MMTEVAEQRRAEGRALRREVSRGAHAAWQPPQGRQDPVEAVVEDEWGRIPELLPERHRRMAQSPFAFFRGSPALMAADLASTPATGIEVQLCGDAHLSNFGTVASPERRQVLDLVDFDETMPGPWEWDVKRLAASAVLAALDNGLGTGVGRAAAVRSVRAYREATADFASRPALDVWYAQLALPDLRALARRHGRRRVDERAVAARRRTSERALSRLTEVVDGRRRLRHEPRLLVPARELVTDNPAEVVREVRAHFGGYLAALPVDRRRLATRFAFRDLALKVVGVGSVGTRCYVVLLEGVDRGEALLLQVREAGPSALAPHLPAEPVTHEGQRIVEGQRLLQAASDLFLGWSAGSTPTRPQHYWRQLPDLKGSADVGALDAKGLLDFAGVCGWTLAHAHARSGDAVAVTGYLGNGASFDEAAGDFAVAYAGQAVADHAAFVAAVADGRLEAAEE